MAYQQMLDEIGIETMVENDAPLMSILQEPDLERNDLLEEFIWE